MPHPFSSTINQRGVTLIETIVSLGILVLGIVSALGLMTSSITYSRVAEQSIVVVNLAREGIEMIRTLRDLNGFDSLTAGQIITSINYVSGDLELLAADSATIENCSNCQLYLYEGRYLHNAPGTATDFRRLIIISDVNEHEKNIVAKVYWTERGRSHNYILETNLDNW